MGIPKEADKLMKLLNQVDEKLEESEAVADSPAIGSDAIREPLKEARESVQIASEQLANYVAGH